MYKLTILVCVFSILFVSPEVFSQPDGSKTGRQQLLYKKNYIAFELSFGPALANRVCVPCYEEEVIYGTNFDAAVSYLVADRFKLSLEAGVFSEAWQAFHDDTDVNSNSYNNNRDYFIVSVAYFPFHFPLWFSVGGGLGNYDFTTNDKPILTSQGTYTYSTIFNYGFELQGGIGYDYLIGKKFKTGIKIVPSYLFLDDLEFVTGETLNNTTGSFVLAASLTFGIHVDMKKAIKTQE